jgi:hypothetical protein
VTTEKPASVLVAGPEDEADIYDFLVNGLYKENPPGFPFSPEAALRQIELATRDNLGKIGIIKGEGQIVASVGIFLASPAWFVDSRDVTWARELWFYVRTFARNGTRHYRDLFQFMRWFRDGIRAGLPPDHIGGFEIITGPATRDRLDLKEKLWARYGSKVGVSFILE